MAAAWSAYSSAVATGCFAVIDLVVRVINIVAIGVGRFGIAVAPAEPARQRSPGGPAVRSIDSPAGPVGIIGPEVEPRMIVANLVANFVATLLRGCLAIVADSRRGSADCWRDFDAQRRRRRQRRRPRQLQRPRLPQRRLPRRFVQRRRPEAARGVRRLGRQESRLRRRRVRRCRRHRWRPSPAFPRRRSYSIAKADGRVTAPVAGRVAAPVPGLGRGDVAGSRSIGAGNRRTDRRRSRGAGGGPCRGVGAGRAPGRRVAPQRRLKVVLLLRRRPARRRHRRPVREPQARSRTTSSSAPTTIKIMLKRFMVHLLSNSCADSNSISSVHRVARTAIAESGRRRNAGAPETSPA